MVAFEGSGESDQFYSVNSEVEVTSDEPGFKGSWYLANVLEPSVPNKHKKAKVEYRTLLTDDGCDLLIEDVDQDFVRPLPPAGLVAAQVFEEGEVVGAYCRDGWWTGVVVKVLRDSRYRVFFDNPPDVIEFHRQDLRLHLEWDNGKWIRPEKQQKAGSMFSTGMDVEVNIKKENLFDAWFPAIVLKEERDNTFLVKYKCFSEDDGVKDDKSTVDFLHIRLSPPPPPHADRKYDLSEKVDAFCDFAWRAGAITKRVTDTKYLVSFEHPNELKEINLSKIRPRVEWKDGEWVSRYQEVLFALDIQDQMRNACKNTRNPEVTVQVESLGVPKDVMDGRTPPSTDSVKNLMDQSNPDDSKVVSYALPPSMKKMKLTAPSCNSIESYPLKKFKIRNTAKDALSATVCQLRKNRSKPSKKVLSGSANPSSRGKQTRDLDIDGNQPFAKVEGLVGEPKFNKQLKLGDLNGQTTSPVKKKGRSTKSQVKSPPSSAAGKKHPSGGGTAKEIVLEGIRKEPEMPVILGLEAKGMGRSDSGNCSQISTEKMNANHLTGDRSIDIDQQKSRGNSMKRKRGRPRKVVSSSSEASEEGKGQNRVGDAADGASMEDHPTEGGASDMFTGGKSTDSHDSSRRKLAGVSVTNCMSDDNGMAIVVSSSHMDDDDRPLSTWFVGMLHCPTSVKESRLSPGRTVVECNEASEGQVDIMQQVHAADDTGGCVLNENRSLPFVKSSLLWKTLESMEIFRMMPQDPHFHPLGICKEEYREGLAIGNMVTFASLTEKISKLHLDQSRSILCGYLESLIDLEKHGFDVTFLRGRMNKLLSIKDRQEQILNESKDAECKIFKYHREKTEMADEMVNITKQIAELEGKCALINSEMERKKVESSRLQMRVDAIKEYIQSAQLDFEKVAAAPWKLG